MKLLIVDDEQLTRDGLLESFHWGQLGIRQVSLAQDGVEGLETARRFRPDIVLSDVRMPRMDGIHMAQRIRELLPDCMIIFMSGYSDKEYLKSAIRLKAVSYVEKPIDPGEVRAALLEAVHQIGERRDSEQGKQLQAAMRQSQLALALIQPQISADLPAQLESLGIPLRRGSTFTVVAADLSRGDEAAVDACTRLLAPYAESFSRQCGGRVISGVKNGGTILCHLLFPQKPPYGAVQRFCTEVLALLRQHCPAFVAAGETAGSLSGVAGSYSDAVSLLQSAFFFEDSALLTPQALGGSHRVEPSLFGAFAAALQSGAPEDALEILHRLQRDFQANNTTLVSYVRDVYSRLLHLLGDAAGGRYIQLWETGEHAGTLTGAVAGAPSLAALHRLLLEKTGQYHQGLAKKAGEDSMIALIQGYIVANLGNSDLSIRTISEHTGLSTSYVCTLYKNETGETLNQFITGTRLEKARQLLRDPRLRVHEIAPAVGYEDSNYFAKLFKKKTGMSPSEYRESSLP